MIDTGRCATRILIEVRYSYPLRILIPNLWTNIPVLDSKVSSGPLKFENAMGAAGGAPELRSTSIAIFEVFSYSLDGSQYPRGDGRTQYLRIVLRMGRESHHPRQTQARVRQDRYDYNQVNLFTFKRQH